MRVEFSLTEKDFVAAQRAHRPWSVFVPIVGGLLVLAGVVALAVDRKNLVSSIEPFLLGVALLFLQRVLWSYHFKNDKRLHDPFVAVISGDGIELSASTVVSRFEWRSFVRFVETKTLFLLYQGPNVFNIFPKRCFGADEAKAFRQFGQEKLNEGRIGRKHLSAKTWIIIVIGSVAFVLMLMSIRNALRQPSSHPAETQSIN